MSALERRCDHRRPVYRPLGVALNIGTGGNDRVGWVNVDETKPGDVLAVVPPLPFRDRTADEVYLGHVLEHLELATGMEILRECWRVMKPEARITVVVPDTRVIAAVYATGILGNGQLNNDYLYSYAQESQHRWSHDARSVRKVLGATGFRCIGRINRYTEPRLVQAAWWQCGMAAKK